jgi:hypothetical protein
MSDRAADRDDSKTWASLPENPAMTPVVFLEA